MRLFSLRFLSPPHLDVLQLVSRGLCSLIEEHRRAGHLALYELDIVCDYKARTFCITPMYYVPRGPDGVCFSLRDDRISVCDSKAVAIRLDSTRVGQVHRLLVRGDIPIDGEKVLAERLLSQGIPIKRMELHNSEYPPSSLQIMNRFGSGWGVECLKMIKCWHLPSEGTALGYIPHIVYCTMGKVFGVQNVLDLFFNQVGFTGRVVARINSSRGDRLDYRESEDAERKSQIVQSLLPALADFYRTAKPIPDSQPNEWTLPWRPHEYSSLAKDVLIVYFAKEEAERHENEPWPVELGPPSETCVMDGACWEEESPIREHYRLLEGCEWAVWRVRNPLMEGRHLRIMQRMSGGDKKICLAVHVQVVKDRDFGIY